MTDYVLKELEDMSTNKTLVEWANKTFPKYKGKIEAVYSEMGTRTGGYCDTCRYEYGVVEFRLVGAKDKFLGYEELETDLATFLNNLLGEG